MNILRLVVSMVLVLGLTGCMSRMDSPRPTDDCPLPKNPDKITIELPSQSASDQRPYVADHPRACFDGTAAVRFAVPRQGIGNVFVIFRDDTPLVDNQGNKLYVLRGPQAMNGNSFSIGESVADGEYKYMLVDIKDSSRPIKDPVIVIER